MTNGFAANIRVESEEDALHLANECAKLKWTASNLDCVGISNIVLTDKFSQWTASTKYNGKELHHYGIGGLARHTWEVYRLMSQSSSVLLSIYDPKLTKEIIFLSALFHDFGKLWDYEWDAKNNEWIRTGHGKEIGHICRSAIEWSNAVKKFPEYEPIHNEILHAILAHHGRKEWGSPITPKTRLAWLLHLSDNLSARWDDCERIEFKS